MSSVNPLNVLALISVLSLTSLLTVNALKCYVCNDCEIYFNETHITDCDEKTGTKCIKMVEANGAVSRDCGSKDICTRQIGTKPQSSAATISKPRPEKLIGSNLNSTGARKRSGQLLQPATTTTMKPEGPPPPEISSLHCCEENECNSAFSRLSPNNFLNTILKLIVPFYTVTLQESLFASS